jgi:hypothetical protein
VFVGEALENLLAGLFGLGFGAGLVLLGHFQVFDD